MRFGAINAHRLRSHAYALLNCLKEKKKVSHTEDGDTSFSVPDMAQFRHGAIQMRSSVADRAVYLKSKLFRPAFQLDLTKMWQ